jgi:hypothetical protein
MVEKTNMIKSVIYFIAGLLAFCSCSHTAEIPALPVVSFSKQVQPVLVANCTMSGCHTSVNTGGEDVFPLVTYNDLTTRNMFVAGNPKTSRLYQSINGTGGSSMPPSGSLGNDDILLIYLWIAQGGKNN